MQSFVISAPHFLQHLPLPLAILQLYDFEERHARHITASALHMYVTVPACAYAGR